MSSQGKSVKQYPGPYPFRVEYDPKPYVVQIDSYDRNGGTFTRVLSTEELKETVVAPPKQDPDIEFVETDSGATYVLLKRKSD